MGGKGLIKAVVCVRRSGGREVRRRRGKWGYKEVMK